ncbi:MAG: MFS transporter [Sphingomicrobium sp.]
MSTVSGEGPRAGFAVGFACTIGPGIVSLIPLAPVAALPALSAHFSAGPNRGLFAQLVVTAPAAVLVLTAPFSGWLAERLGSRLVLILSLLLFAVAGGSGLIAANTAQLVAGRLILGLAGGGILSSALALIGANFTGNKRDWVLGFATSLSAVVAIVALIGGGLLVDAAGWQAALGLYLIGLPAAGMVALVLPPSPAQPLAERRRFESRTFAGLLPILALLIISAIAIFMPSLQASMLLSERFHLNGAQTGLVLSSSALVAMIAAGLYGWLRRFLSINQVFAFNALCFGSGMIAIALATSPFVVAFGCALIGVGGGTTEPAGASAALSRMPANHHGRASGIVVSSVFLGQFLNPLAIAPIRQWGGLTAAFLGFGLLMLLLAAGLAVIHRRKR